MHKYNHFFQILMWVGAAVEASILVMLFVRREWTAWKSVGFFCVCDLAFDVALAVTRAHTSTHRYFYLYWAASSVDALVRLWILSDVLDSFPGVAFLRRELRWSVAVAGAFMAAGSAFVALRTGPVLRVKVMTAVLNLHRCVNIGWGAFFIAALIAVVIFHLGWSRRGAMIANALLLNVVIGVIASYLIAGDRNSFIGNTLQPFAGFTMISIWLFALASPEEVYSAPPEFAAALARGPKNLKTT